MKLHYNPMSSSSRRVTITAALLGIRFDEHVVDLRDRASRAELERLNANSKVPVLEDDGFVLWESNAIATPLMMSRPARLPVRPYSHIAAWHAKVQELPAWKATEPPPIG